MGEEKLIEQSYWTDVSLKTECIIERLIELFALRDDEFTPTVFYGERYTKRRNKKFDKSMVGTFKEAFLASDVNYVVLTNSDRAKNDMLFGVRINMMNKFSVFNFSATHSYFINEERLEKFISIGMEVTKVMNPIYGCIHDVEDSNTIMNGKAFKILEYIPATFWGNYFGKNYIEKIGREKLLSFKGYKVEQLDNDDIYIQISPSPLNPTSSEDRKAQSVLAKLIGVKGQGNVFTNTYNGIFGK